MHSCGGRIRGAAWLALLCLVFVSASGCVSETKSGDKNIFTYEWWVPLSLILGGIVAGPAGWFLRSVSGRLGFGLMILCPIGIVMGTSLFTDRAEVDPTGYVVHTGIFGSASFDGKFDNIAQINLTSEVSRGRRGSKTNYYLNCQEKTGGHDKIPLGNAIVQQAAPLILDYAQQKGIPVIDQQ